MTFSEAVDMTIPEAQAWLEAGLELEKAVKS